MELERRACDSGHVGQMIGGGDSDGSPWAPFRYRLEAFLASRDSVVFVQTYDGQPASRTRMDTPWFHCFLRLGAATHLSHFSQILAVDPEADTPMDWTITS